jgi:immunoglobulin-binding protein 1
VPLPKFKPYVLGSRADLQKQVFQPGHNLPTMSIEEFYEMRYGQGKDKPLINQPIKPKKDANDEDESSVYMQRKKDELNDDNARGSGNRFNRS